VIIAAALAQLAGSGADSCSSTSPRPRSTSRQLEIAALLRDMHLARRIAIVISTHDLNFAAGLCQSLVLLRNGAVLAAGPTVDVLTVVWIRLLYGVEAEVERHRAAGHLVVVPLRRSSGSGT
jgi:ABC-type cobalamin/Fe3+-siderophores transport system ATPase subunit